MFAVDASALTPLLPDTETSQIENPLRTLLAHTLIQHYLIRYQKSQHSHPHLPQFLSCPLPLANHYGFGAKRHRVQFKPCHYDTRFTNASGCPKNGLQTSASRALGLLHSQQNVKNLPRTHSHNVAICRIFIEPVSIKTELLLSTF